MSHLLLVDLEWTFAFARRAEADADFPACILIERTKDGTALSVVELDVIQLREHPTTASNDSQDVLKVVEMHVAKFA